MANESLYGLLSGSSNDLRLVEIASVMDDQEENFVTSLSTVYEFVDQLPTSALLYDPYDYGVAIVQFILTAVLFLCLLYCIARDYMEVQRRQVMGHGDVADDGADMLMADDDDDPVAAAGPDGGGTGTALRHRQQPPLPTVQLAAPRPPQTAVPAAATAVSASLPLDNITNTSTTSASGLTPPSAAITGNDRDTTTDRADDGATDAGKNTTRRGEGRYGGGAGSKLKKMRYSRKQQMPLPNDSDIDSLLRMIDTDKAVATGNDYLDISLPAATPERLQQQQQQTYADIITLATVPHHDVAVGMPRSARYAAYDAEPYVAHPIHSTARSGLPVRPTPLHTMRDSSTPRAAFPTKSSVPQSTVLMVVPPVSAAAAVTASRPSSIPTLIVSARTAQMTTLHQLKEFDGLAPSGGGAQLITGACRFPVNDAICESAVAANASCCRQGTGNSVSCSGSSATSSYHNNVQWQPQLQQQTPSPETVRSFEVRTEDHALSASSSTFDDYAESDMVVNSVQETLAVSHPQSDVTRQHYDDVITEVRSRQAARTIKQDTVLSYVSTARDNSNVVKLPVMEVSGILEDSSAASAGVYASSNTDGFARSTMVMSTATALLSSKVAETDEKNGYVDENSFSEP